MYPEIEMMEIETKSVDSATETLGARTEEMDSETETNSETEANAESDPMVAEPVLIDAEPDPMVAEPVLIDAEPDPMVSDGLPLDVLTKLKRFCFLGSFDPVYIHLRKPVDVNKHYADMEKYVQSVNDEHFAKMLGEALHGGGLVRKDETLFIYAAYLALVTDNNRKTNMRKSFTNLILTDDDLFLFCKYATKIAAIKSIKAEKKRQKELQQKEEQQKELQQKELQQIEKQQKELQQKELQQKEEQQKELQQKEQQKELQQKGQQKEKQKTKNEFNPNAIRFSRTVRKAVQSWYEMKTAEEILSMFMSHRGQYGYTHKLLIKMCHIKDDTIGGPDIVTPFFKTCSKIIKESEKPKLIDNGDQRGPNGANEANGANGVNGANGANGANGPSGAIGANGPSGASDPSGSGNPSGSSNPTGASKPSGAGRSSGPSGASGSSGPSGAIGASGPSGASDPSGSCGPSGSSGTSGVSGSSGPSWSSDPRGASRWSGPSGASAPGGASSSGGAIGSKDACGSRGVKGRKRGRGARRSKGAKVEKVVQAAKSGKSAGVAPKCPVVAIAKLRTTKIKHEAIKIVRKFRLPYNQIPRHLFQHNVILEAVLPTMPYLQILKCWRKMARNKHLESPNVLNICKKVLENQDLVKELNVYPIHILMAMHDVGFHEKISKSQKESLKLDYLDRLYSESFNWHADSGDLRMHITVNLQQNYKKKILKNHRKLTFYEACRTLALGYAKREAKVHIFHWYEEKNLLKPIVFEEHYNTATALSTFDLVQNLKNNQRLTTPLENALESKELYDVFLCIVPTAGRGNPRKCSQLLCKYLDKYRQEINSKARFVILDLLRHRASMSYSKTRQENILEICGLDEHTTTIIHNFVNGRFD